MVSLIRPARLSDAADIAAIHVAGWVAADHLPKVPPSLDQRLELWHHVLGGGSRRVRVWVALDVQGHTIGFCSAGAARVLRTEFDGELTAIYVAPDWQWKGVGRALVTLALECLADRGDRTAMAWVSEGSQAQSFLTKMGAIPQPAHRRRDEIAVGWLT